MLLPMSPQKRDYHQTTTSSRSSSASSSSTRCGIGTVKSTVALLLLLPLFMTCNSSILATALEPQPTPIQQPPPTADVGGLYRGDADRYGNDSMGYHTTTTNDENVDSQGELPSEIQKAVCTVTAGEVKASAEAVTTKTLKGVCGSAELHLALSTLESKLYQELHEIKTLLHYLSQKNVGVSFEMPTTKFSTLETSTSKTNLKFQPIFETPQNSLPEKFAETPMTTPSTSTVTTSTDYSKPVTFPKLKSLPSSAAVERQRGTTHLREQEVSKFNNTMLTDRDFKVFTYYWKLENFTERIESGISATVESPIFSIKGKTLHIRAYFQHLHRDLLYLQLAYAAASLHASQRNNIILDMGGLFKEIHQSSDRVIFKHKITILDQNNQRSKDLVSQEFNNLETGFFIPNSALLASPYVKNNSLLIQIFLYL